MVTAPRGCSVRCGGYTLIEVACAFAVLSVLATTVFVGERSGVDTLTHSFRETVALHLAAGSLESLAASGKVLQAGKTRIDLDAQSTHMLPRPQAYRIVRELKPGLFEVTAEVSWLDGASAQRVRVQLATLIAQETGR
jgi:prepilin-type N-terminal cleavage/methylation domain-containing protein